MRIKVNWRCFDRGYTRWIELKRQQQQQKKQSLKRVESL